MKVNNEFGKDMKGAVIGCVEFDVVTTVVVKI
jgi:hypothetical protein